MATNPEQTPWKSRVIGHERVAPESLKPHPQNWRLHTAEQRRAFQGLIGRVGFVGSIIANKTTGHIIDGHLRQREAIENAEKLVDVLWVELSAEEENIVLASFDPLGMMAGRDDAMLNDLLAAMSSSDSDMVRRLMAQEEPLTIQEDDRARQSLAERFGVPPFSVLDTRQGYWQARKRAWLSLGIKSEIGRGANLLRFSDTILEPNPEARARRVSPGGGNGANSVYKSSGSSFDGTSVFDPVLCELVYRWFCPSGGKVLDPFAGGSVRGIVASYLGRSYLGFDLREDQVKANEEQRIAGKEPAPVWRVGDSAQLRKLAKKEPPFDFLFSCPPYGNLERYSEDPRDLSTLEHSEFLEAYRSIIGQGVEMLGDDRFACFVVGDFRDDKGMYRNFVSDTIAAFEKAGARLYNYAILVSAVGSLPLRAGKQFAGSRKLGKCHQDVLVFVKGDPKEATKACGSVNVEFGAELGGVEAIGGEIL